MSKIIPILLISIILSACAASPPPANTPTPEPLATPTSSSSATCSPPSTWTIQYNRSGGFAGFDETLTLDSAGSLTVQSERPAMEDQKTISADQVQAITELLAQACPFEAGPTNGVCADCFFYKLDVQMDGRTYSVQASDVTLTKKLQPLINTLSQLLQESGQ
jgi:hypothetical protein